MNRSAIAACALFLCAGATSSAQTATHADYSPLEFLVGSCWVGRLDAKTTDTHCFEWQYDKRFIRDHHVVNSTPTYEGETLYSWDLATKRIIFRYWSNGGLVLDGTVTKDGDSIVFPSHYPNAAGSLVDLRAVWTRVGDSAYSVVQSQKSARGWETGLRALYVRAAK